MKRIFALCAEGKGPNQIARLLTKEQVLTPSNYYQKTGASHAVLDTTRLFSWTGSSVTGILDNKTYLGHMAGLRSTTLSYKNKKLIRHPESEQILVENTHEPLITQELWDIVHVLGRVTNEQFRILSGDYNAEQKELSAAIPEKESWLEKLKASAANVEAFIEKAKRYTEIPELTPEILRLFISRIEIGERSEKHSRTAEQEIRIVYRDVGVMDSVEQVTEDSENMERANIA